MMTIRPFTGTAAGLNDFHTNNCVPADVYRQAFLFPKGKLMKNTILVLAVATLVAACSSKPPQPSGVAFPINQPATGVKNVR
ncbi:hypothetical protein [Neisseria sp.]|uniref:hypothetical protein n=1 Tax=Neisseria sp. TaxID=192066 RepID=UPI0026DD02A5|nr:hypothetical protein [Neisseria sp.]MDO4226194.1 hypothetical protein [Neisseria sp.]